MLILFFIKVFSKLKVLYEGINIFAWWFSLFILPAQGCICSMWILSCDIWDLDPLLEIEPGPPALVTCSLSLWTPREVPSPELFEVNAISAVPLTTLLLLSVDPHQWLCLLVTDFPFILLQLLSLRTYPCGWTIQYFCLPPPWLPPFPSPPASLSQVHRRPTHHP